MAIWESPDKITPPKNAKGLHTVVVHPEKNAADFEKMKEYGYKEVSTDPKHGAINGQVIMGIDEKEWEAHMKRQGEASHRFYEATDAKIGEKVDPNNAVDAISSKKKEWESHGAEDTSAADEYYKGSNKPDNDLE